MELPPCPFRGKIASAHDQACTSKNGYSGHSPDDGMGETRPAVRGSASKGSKPLPTIMKLGQQRPKDRKAVMSVVRRHPFITFLPLAYALSWTAI
jgi:hypothetical protein